MEPNQPQVIPQRKHKLVHVCLLIVAALLLGSLGMWFGRLSTTKTGQKANIGASQTAPVGSSAVPKLQTELMVQSLDHPWDIAFLPDGTLLYTERVRGLSLTKAGVSKSLYKPDDMIALGEGGMLGMTTDTEFTNNRFIYVCMNSKKAGTNDVRLIRLKLNDTYGVVDRKDIITGMPMNSSGRHSGCRPRMDDSGVLWVGSGDAATADVPQNPKSLGGKILRVDREGAPVQGNQSAPFDPRIYSYGHRNIQGIALFALADKSRVAGFSIEHGTDRDDEINELVPGNFGWDPIPAPYNEKTAMTDIVKFKSAITAVWTSGLPTIAPSGGVIVKGSQWGVLNGALVVGVLKDKHIHAFELDSTQKVTANFELLNQYGRIRSIIQNADGSLYFSTDNGQNQDVIVRLVPS